MIIKNNANLNQHKFFYKKDKINVKNYNNEQNIIIELKNF